MFGTAGPNSLEIPAGVGTLLNRTILRYTFHSSTLISLTRLSYIASQSSQFVPPADGRSTAGFVDPSAHGNGPVQVSLPTFSLATDSIVLNTAKQLGGRFAFVEDFNSGNFVGISTLTGLM